MQHTHAQCNIHTHSAMHALQLVGCHMHTATHPICILQHAHCNMQHAHTATHTHTLENKKCNTLRHRCTGTGDYTIAMQTPMHTLQLTAAHCNTLHRTATIVLHHTLRHCNTHCMDSDGDVDAHTATLCSISQHTATLQHIATRGIALQCVY